MAPVVKMLTRSNQKGKNPIPTPLIQPPKNHHFFQSSQHHQSGYVTASVPRKFPNKAQNEPRSISDHPLFDQKLLEYLHEEGVRKES